MLEDFRQFCGSRKLALGSSSREGVSHCPPTLGAVALGAVSPSLAQITQDAYVANQHDNTVSVVDTTPQGVVNTIAAGSMGSDLLGVAETSDGLHVYVMNQR
jgi:YVTN family beta-propeller protein